MEQFLAGCAVEQAQAVAWRLEQPLALLKGRHFARMAAPDAGRARGDQPALALLRRGGRCGCLRFDGAV